MKTGLIIWRNNFQYALHIWQKDKNTFVHHSLAEQEQHNEDDFKLAEQKSKLSNQAGKLYFLEDK